MIGKATLEDFQKAKRQINKPLYQIHMDSFSSSVESIEKYNHAIIFVDAATGYRWIYGMETKDDAIKALRTWYADIADLRTKHKLVVLMRDNASEYKSEEKMQFLKIKKLLTRSVSGCRRTKPCMVKRKTFQISEHSAAGLGYI